MEVEKSKKNVIPSRMRFFTKVSTGFISAFAKAEIETKVKQMSDIKILINLFMPQNYGRKSNLQCFRSLKKV